MRINSQKVWVFVASAILRKPRLIPSAKITFISPIRSAQGAPVRRWVNASVKPVAASTSSREIGDARGRDLLVEIEHQIFGACRRGGFEFLDMQNAVFNRPARDRACASGTAKLAQPHVEASLPVCQPFLRPQWHSETTAFRDGLCRNECVFQIAIAPGPSKPDISGADNTKYKKNERIIY